MRLSPYLCPPPKNIFNSKRFARPHQPFCARWPRIQRKQQEEGQELRQEQPRRQGQGQGVRPDQQRDRSLEVYLRGSALPSCDDRNLPERRPPMRRSVNRYGAYMLSKLTKWSLPRFPRPEQWPKSGQFLLTAFAGAGGGSGPTARPKPGSVSAGIGAAVL